LIFATERRRQSCEPTSQQVDDLIAGVKKTMKTLF